MNRIASQSIGVRGFFKMEAFQGEYVYNRHGEHMLDINGNPVVREYEGTRRVVADWFPNQILDAGRNRMGSTSNWAGGGSKCQVGNDNTEPTSADTQLHGYVAGTVTIQASSFGAQSSAPWFHWDQVTYRFAQGVAAGNLSEAGVGWDTIDGPYLITRALIVDGDGEPFTPTVLATEWLDVTYQLQYYPPLEDVEGTVTLNGIVYDTITRAANVNSGGGNIGMQMGVWSTSVTYWKAYDGNIGTIIQSPSGTWDDADTSGQYNLSYVNNSYYRDMQIDCGINGWNLGAGIRSILITTNAGNFQTQFNAQGSGNTINKSVDFYMTFIWRLSWAGWYWANTYNMQAASDATTPTTGNWNTNVAGTLLRINWDDTGATDHQEDLQLESDTLFKITQDSDTTKWAFYRAQAIYSEGVDYTSYTVVLESSQNSGPTVGQACTITAVDS